MIYVCQFEFKQNLLNFKINFKSLTYQNSFGIQIGKADGVSQIKPIQK